MITIEETRDDEDDFYNAPVPDATSSIKKETEIESIPRSFADLQGKMTFVQASDDPFNNAVSFSSASHHRYSAAEVMPDGYDDTEEDRLRLLDVNPKDDNVLLAPRREEIDEFLAASSDLFRRQRTIGSSNTRRLGARSMLWPALEEADYDHGDAPVQHEPRRSYANYTTEMEFDKRAEEAMRRGRNI